jgi:hypothetical protein
MLDFVRSYSMQPLANDYLEDCYHLSLFFFWVYLYVRRQLSLTQRVVLSQKNILIHKQALFAQKFSLSPTDELHSRKLEEYYHK